MSSGIRKAGLVALVGAIMGVGVYGCKKEEPRKEEELYKQSKIAFTSKRDGNNEIYVINADGSGLKNLTNNPADDGTFSWSPDGRKIAFRSDRDEKNKASVSQRERNYEIYVMNVDGSEQKRLTNNPAGDSGPSWSPDGKKIAFFSEHGPKNNDEAKEWHEKLGYASYNYEIYVMNADGSKLKRLTDNPPAADYSTYWSPDGRKIAFTSNRDGNYELYVMNPDGSGQKRLTNNSTLDIGSLWSPDGKKIAFISNRDGNYEIYSMNADGSKQKRLTNSPARDFGPSWSPDGKKIAFVSMHEPKNRDPANRNFEIHVMNADGSEQKRLTNNPGRDWLVSWSPDGKKIVFQSDRDGNAEIYVMNADGTEQKRLTDNRAMDAGPSWSPFLPLENKTMEKK